MIVQQQDDLHLVRYKIGRAARRFTLSQSFTVSVNDEHHIDVPVGFSTDLASIPAIARWRVSKLDGIEAAVVHDYLYSGLANSMWTKDLADEIFYKLLLCDRDVSRHTAKVMYKAVSWFGGSSWKGK